MRLLPCKGGREGKQRERNAVWRYSGTGIKKTWQSVRGKLERRKLGDLQVLEGE